MKERQPTIGLEIHVQLKTRTKMFCNSANDPDPPADEAGEKRPNANICPICMGHPGTLPTINKKAVEHVLRVGLAIGGQIADWTEFDRKNYFYPDLPKGYQISQYKYPLVIGGSLNSVAITRVHLEEDTARSIHDDKNGGSLIDFNRAGVPLLELVTEPVIRNARAAGDFARELQLLLRYLDVSEANMEKGEMRVEANVSISRFDLKDPSPKVEPFKKLGTKVEVKNLNSFRSLERAIEYEVNRQIELLADGNPVLQETRGWDEVKEKTFSQREKESAHDYRYFPDPDLPKLQINQIEDFKNLAATIPELPWQKRERYRKDYGIKEADIEIYVKDQAKAEKFESVMEILEEKRLAQLVSNYILTDIVRPLPVASIVGTIKLVDGYELSSRGAKDLLKILPEKEINVREFAERKGLIQKSDETTLRHIVNQVVAENPKVVADYENGKKESLQFLIGQGMKASRAAANPQVLKRLFEEILGDGRISTNEKS